MIASAPVAQVTHTGADCSTKQAHGNKEGR